jgi:hypothetical protein
MFDLLIRHRHWMRGTHIRRVLLVWIAGHIIASIATSWMLTSATEPCQANDSQWRIRSIMLTVHAVLITPFVIWFVVVVWLLRKHATDSYGIKSIRALIINLIV